MKKITKLILLLLVLHSVNVVRIMGQTTFFKWSVSNTYEVMSSIIILHDSSYLLSGYGYPEGAMKSKAFLLHYDNMGNEIGKQFTSEDMDGSSFDNLFFMHDSLFAVKTNFREIGDKVYDELWFCKVNTAELTSQPVKKYRFIAGKICAPQFVIKTEDGLFILFLQFYLEHANHKNGYFITKFNQTFDTLTSFYDTNFTYNNWGLGLINNSAYDQLKSVANFQYTTIINDFNYNLENIKTNVINPYITAFSASNYNDSTYMTTGVHYQVEDPERPIRYVVTRKYNWQDEVLDTAYYYNTTDDTVSYSGFMNNTLRFNDKIFVTGTYNVDTHNWPYQNEPSWIELTIYDTALSRLKKCFYGGDAFYECWSITQTPDNAVLIAGNRYDHNEPGYLYHPFILKVTTDGLLTANNNEPEKRAHDAIVFPNPGSKYLSVRSGPQIFGATFELFDLNGRLVKQEIISKQTTTVSTTDMSTGTYVWRILYKNKEVESGKWIKSL